MAWFSPPDIQQARSKSHHHRISTAGEPITRCPQFPRKFLNLRTKKARVFSSQECQPITANLNSATALSNSSNSALLSRLPMPASYAPTALLRRCMGQLASSYSIPLSESSILHRTLAASIRWVSGSIACLPSAYSVSNLSELATRSAIADFSRASPARRAWFRLVSRTTANATSPPITAARNAPTAPLQSWIHSGLSIPHNIPKAYRRTPRGLVQR